jgi:hypothetical protein
MPAINDWSDVLALWLTILIVLFAIFLIVGTLAFIFGDDDENEKTN